MAFNGVPWAITGSQLDTFVMREFADMAMQDSEGINLPGQAKVTAMGSPSGNVNVAAGTLALKNRQASGEMYIGAIASDTTVPIPATGGSGRSDLIVATIRDPDFSPWTPYTDPNQILFGPYFYPERLPSVSAATVRANQVVSYTAYALARIDIPASTTNILNAHIVDLRNLARPRIGFASALQQGPGSTEDLLVSETTYHMWPSNSMSVTIPSWATHCVGSIQLNQVQVEKTAADFEGRVNLGGLTGNAVNFDYNGSDWSPLGFVEGQPFTMFCDIDVRSIAGQTVTCFPQVRRIFTANTGGIWFNSRQQVAFDLRFVERAV